MIVFHHNDADGRCAAAIAKLWYDQSEKVERLEFVEMDYARRVPLELIQRNDTVVIVDFSFKPEDMKAAQAATDVGVVWCDHHATAKDYGYDVPGVRDFGDKGLAGCECTWRFFFPSKRTPNWVRVLGDYDAWRMQEKDLSLPFFEGLKLEDQNPIGSWNIWKLLFADETETTANQILEQGKTAIRYRDAYCEEMCKSFGYETTIGGQRAYAINSARFGSQAFGDKFRQYPVCIMHIFDGHKHTVSLYSATVDVSLIAQSLGGGGHKGAAGFVCNELPFKAE